LLGKSKIAQGVGNYCADTSQRSGSLSYPVRLLMAGAKSLRSLYENTPPGSHAAGRAAEVRLIERREDLRSGAPPAG